MTVVEPVDVSYYFDIVRLISRLRIQRTEIRLTGLVAHQSLKVKMVKWGLHTAKLIWFRRGSYIVDRR